MRHTLLLLAVLAVMAIFPGVAPAPIVWILSYEPDKEDVVKIALREKAGNSIQVDIEEIKTRMLKWTERDFLAVFGKPSVSKDFTMFACEPRRYMTSGLRYADPKLNKDRTDSHLVGDMGRFDVRYGINGETPALIQFRIKMGKNFPVLDREDNIAPRLAYERSVLTEMKEIIHKKTREVFCWEIDVEAMKKQFVGIDSPKFEEKVAASLKWSESQGYRNRHNPIGGDWYARDADDVVRAWITSTQIQTYRADRTTIRDDMLQGTDAITVRWYRDKDQMIRYEQGIVSDGHWRPRVWIWYDRNGKIARSEWDTNGDDIPDTSGDYFGGQDKKKERLAMEQSWAVNPELIATDCRVPNQELRRLRLRKIATK